MGISSGFRSSCRLKKISWTECPVCLTSWVIEVGMGWTEGAVRVVELLGYHTLGGDKRQHLGLPQALPGTAPMAPEALRRHGEAMVELLQGCGITVRWR